MTTFVPRKLNILCIQPKKGSSLHNNTAHSVIFEYWHFNHILKTLA